MNEEVFLEKLENFLDILLEDYNMRLCKGSEEYKSIMKKMGSLDESVWDFLGNNKNEEITVTKKSEIKEFIDAIEDVRHIEGKAIYFHGYIDCIKLMHWLGFCR